MNSVGYHSDECKLRRLAVSESMPQNYRWLINSTVNCRLFRLIVFIFFINLPNPSDISLQRGGWK